MATTDKSRAAPRRRPRIAVAGASGFIGSALRHALAESYEVLALTRFREPAQSARDDDRVTWHCCDLFSLKALRAGLAGIDYAVYLVHSQAPSSRLTQANPRDMDLVLADNFAQVAAENGIKQIVFISGLMPEGFHISRLLWSRREVEMVLASRGTPVTVLRAGLVVGRGGPGPSLMADFVRRLPLVPLPRAARSVTRPIALVDLIRAIKYSLGRPEAYRGVFDVGGPDCLSYQAMLQQTAETLGKRRWIFTLPLLPLGLAATAARLVSGAPPSLVGPIIESLPRDTIMRDNALQRLIDQGAVPFHVALQDALDRAVPPREHKRARARFDRPLIRRASLVRSIQRIILPPGQDAAWVAGNYFRWLERALWPFVRSHRDATGSWSLSLRFTPLQLLYLKRNPALCTPQRQVFEISAGLLRRPTTNGSPRFEFQTLLDDRYTMAAIQDYAPALPWYVYRWTQAIIHRWIMRHYQGHLARLAR